MTRALELQKGEETKSVPAPRFQPSASSGSASVPERSSPGQTASSLLLWKQVSKQITQDELEMQKKALLPSKELAP